MGEHRATTSIHAVQETAQEWTLPTSRVRARSSRRVLEAARALVEAEGLESLSMRRLAAEADVSVRTLYNLFGDKDGLVAALVQQSFAAMDTVVEDTSPEDPVERIWCAVQAAVEASCRYVPRAVTAAVLADPALHTRLSRSWHGLDITVSAIEEATRKRMLRPDVPAPRLAAQAGAVLSQRFREWAAGELDERQLTATALHAFDLVLLAVATPRTRERLLVHLADLEPSLPRERSRA